MRKHRTHSHRHSHERKELIQHLFVILETIANSTPIDDGNDRKIIFNITGDAEERAWASGFIHVLMSSSNTLRGIKTEEKKGSSSEDKSDIILTLPEGMSAARFPDALKAALPNAYRNMEYLVSKVSPTKIGI